MTMMKTMTTKDKFKGLLPERKKKIEDRTKELSQCVCRKPLLLYVPPGKVATMFCPVHGDFDIHGGPEYRCAL